MIKLVGGILLAIGILIAGASGLCSGFMLITGMSEPASMAGMLPVILVVGGIPFALGLGLIFAGLALIRHARREDDQS